MNYKFYKINLSNIWHYRATHRFNVIFITDKTKFTPPQDDFMFLSFSLGKCWEFSENISERFCSEQLEDRGKCCVVRELNFQCRAIVQRVIPSGQDSSILPARVANHSVGFDSSCPVAEPLCFWEGSFILTVILKRQPSDELTVRKLCAKLCDIMCPRRTVLFCCFIRLPKSSQIYSYIDIMKLILWICECCHRSVANGEIAKQMKWDFWTYVPLAIYLLKLPSQHHTHSTILNQGLTDGVC